MSHDPIRLPISFVNANKVGTEIRDNKVAPVRYYVMWMWLLLPNRMWPRGGKVILFGSVVLDRPGTADIKKTDRGSITGFAVQ